MAEEKYLSKDEAVAMLRRSVKEWNAYRETISYYRPNYSGISLYGANLREVDLHELNLQEVDFREADLEGANFIDSDLIGANFGGADLSESALHEADLRGADFFRCDFIGTDFIESDLREADFLEVRLHSCNFINVDLSSVRSLDTAKHIGPSTISISTLVKSNFNIPEAFLEGAGVPRQLIDYLPAFKNIPIQYYSCFISYSSKDEAFATRLYEGLKSQGIRVWYAPEEMKGGRFLLDQIDQAIRLHDKLLLVLSEDSMNSDWVNR